MLLMESSTGTEERVRLEESAADVPVDGLDEEGGLKSRDALLASGLGVLWSAEMALMSTKCFWKTPRALASFQSWRDSLRIPCGRIHWTPQDGERVCEHRQMGPSHVRSR